MENKVYYAVPAVPAVPVSYPIHPIRSSYIFLILSVLKINNNISYNNTILIPIFIKSKPKVIVYIP